MTPEQFATEQYPLHASGLHEILECTLKAYLELTERGDSNAAADTGNAVHFAARMFHGMGKKDARLSLALMQEHLKRGEYPNADADEAARHFHAYAKDPRNVNAKIILNEKKVSFQLAPHKEDKTQAAIFVVGTLDQIRELEDGSLCLFDIKSGRALWGKQMLDYHAAQMAAYMIGATMELGRPVTRACIIRTDDYKSSGPVFWYTPYTLRDAPAILYGVRKLVAAVRNRDVFPNPGSACRFCYFDGGRGSVANCVEKLYQIGVNVNG